MISDLRGNGTLIIVVLKAKNLPNRRKLDKQNPYCIARIANIVDRTPAITRGGQTPEWNHESRFQLTTEINPLLKLSVLDETKKSPVLIGDAEIDCSPVFNTTSDEGYDKWHPLQYAGRSAGEVYVEMTFYPTAPIEPVKKKGAITLHRNTVRPLPTRPGEEESFIDYDDDDEEDDDISVNTASDSFRSYRPSTRAPVNPYGSSGSTFSDNASSYLSDFNSSEESRSRSRFAHHYNTSNSYANHNPMMESQQSSAMTSIFDDSIARQILKEYPGKFEELLARNPHLASSLLQETSNGNSIYNNSRYGNGNSHYGNSGAGSASYRKSHSTSPVRHAPYQRNMQSINASFDDLEKEVQTDWYRNNFGTSRYSQYMGRNKSRSPQRHNNNNNNDDHKNYQDSTIDPMKISSVLPKLPEFTSSKASSPHNNRNPYINNNIHNHYNNNNGTVPPPPPHKSMNSRMSPQASSRYVRKPPESIYSQKSAFSPFPRKKAPPPDYSNNANSHKLTTYNNDDGNDDEEADMEMAAKLSDLNLSSISSIPYSADEIDMNASSNDVYLGGKKIGNLNALQEKLKQLQAKDEFDPKYSIPSPDQLLSSRRKNNNNTTKSALGNNKSTNNNPTVGSRNSDGFGYSNGSGASNGSGFDPNASTYSANWDVDDDDDDDDEHDEYDSSRYGNGSSGYDSKYANFVGHYQ